MKKKMVLEGGGRLVKVMNVIIPKDLRHALQTATTYDVLL
jgi:hypothetical protein